MRFAHPDHPGRGVRLAYCLNLHPAEALEGVLRGLCEVTVPLARRLARGRTFGIGPWLAAAVAEELGAGSEARAGLCAFFAEHDLEPFTFNAFPFGGFHAAGLKCEVFRPEWSDPRRVRYTLQVAGIAADLAGAAAAGSHVSISTHAGGFGGADRDERRRRAEGLAQAARGLARLASERGVRIVLGLEPEPRSHANDTRELAELFGEVHTALGRSGDAAAAEHLGTCLDACHAAVEFEDEAEAFRRATEGVPLAKLQFTSALALPHPAADEAGRERLFALHEPVYLHQVTAKGARGFARALDLDEARRAWEANAPGWRDADELRCHFHVPVHLERFAELDPDAGGLATTRASADRLLARTLVTPARWGTPELHVEIETYTWNVLPVPDRGAAPLLDGLTAEYRHVLDLLALHGWRPAE